MISANKKYLQAHGHSININEDNKNQDDNTLQLKEENCSLNKKVADFETLIRNLESKNQELYLKTTDFERSESDKAR